MKERLTVKKIQRAWRNFLTKKSNTELKQESASEQAIQLAKSGENILCTREDSGIVAEKIVEPLNESPDESADSEESLHNTSVLVPRDELRVACAQSGNAILAGCERKPSGGVCKSSCASPLVGSAGKSLAV